MFIKLPEPVVVGNREFNGVHVMLNHANETVVCANGNLSNHQTKILIKTENAVICKAEAKCSEFDTFTKSTGRQYALERALKQDTDHILSRNNRQALWELFCPKLGRKSKRIKVKKNEQKAS